MLDLQPEIDEADELHLRNGCVCCPWYKHAVRAADACFATCLYGDGQTKQGLVICLWRASGSPPKPQ